ncbi:MAG: flippase [Candidatus Bathyarchaeota archaeon]|nr:flippase [Candidatus Bathyarchaeota archaeon]
MTKVSDMAKISARGGFHYMWGLAVSTVISAIGTIIIASLLGENNYGAYFVALSAPNLLLLFRDWGVNSAIVRYTAQFNVENKAEKIRSVFVSGLVFEIVFGLLLSVIGFSLSGVLANLFNRPDVAPLIQVASFSVLAGAFVNTATAAFTGTEKMHLCSIMTVSQALIKTILIVVLVVLGLGPLGAIMGFTVAFLIAGLIGVMLMFGVYRKLPPSPLSISELKTTMKAMFRYGFPLSFGVIFSGILLQFYNFLLVIYVSNDALLGNYSVAQNFVVLITFFALPVTTMLFPAFSKIDGEKDPQALQSVYQFSVKYSALLVVPVATMVMALAQPAISTVFPNQYAEAPLFLALLAIAYVYSAFGHLSIVNLINGQGQTTYTLKLSLMTAAVGFPLGFVLISQLGVIGLVISTLISAIPNMIFGLRFIKKRYGVSTDWNASAKIVLSSFTAASLTYLLVTQLALSSLIELFLGVIVFVVVFVLAVLLTRAINESDISNLRVMTSGLGPLSVPLDRILTLLEKLMAKIKL